MLIKQFSTGLLALSALAFLICSGSTPRAAIAEESGEVKAAASKIAAPETITHWIRQLDSDKFSQRRRAMQGLIEAGESAIPALAKAAQNESLEVRSRVFFILRSLSLSPHRSTQQAASETLEILASSSNSISARQAVEALESYRQAKVQNAIAFLKDRGGIVQINQGGANRNGPSGDNVSYIVNIGNNWKGQDEDLEILKTLQPLTRLSLMGSSVSNAGLTYVAGMSELTRLHLDSSKITGRGLSQLKNLPKLQNLTLSRLKIKNSDLSHLDNLKTIEFLNLIDTQIGDEGLRSLANLPNLKSLYLERTRITDAGLVHLSSIKTLTRLQLSNTSVKGPGLAHLQELANLQHLYLANSKINDALIKNVSSLTHLQYLNLDYSSISDRHLESFRSLKNLNSLSLNRTQVSDAGLEHLKDIKGLRVIRLQGTKVTKAGEMELKKTFPRAYISR